MNIIYMGSPDFAIPALRKIYESEHNLLCCYSQPPREKNRGKKVVNTVIHDYCLDHGIDCHTPLNFKNEYDLDFVRNLNPDLLVVCAYGLILPEELLQIPKFGAINIHPSSLPRWRGAAPIQRTIMSGDKETAICIIKMTKELDQGDIILHQDMIINDSMTASQLHDEASKIGADLMISVINSIAGTGKIVGVPQSEIGVTYASKIQKLESKIDFNKTGLEIMNLIRGLADYPAAYTELKGKRLKIFKAEFIEQNNNQSVNTVLLDKDNFTINCIDGLIRPLIIQLEGKQRMSVEDFLKGQQ